MYFYYYIIFLQILQYEKCVSSQLTLPNSVFTQIIPVVTNFGSRYFYDTLFMVRLFIKITFWVIRQNPKSIVKFKSKISVFKIRTFGDTIVQRNVLFDMITMSKIHIHLAPLFFASLYHKFAGNAKGESDFFVGSDVLPRRRANTSSLPQKRKPGR